MERYDVLVVGAGLAGLWCSRLLAEHGRTVLLVDRKKQLDQAIHTTGIFVKRTLDDFNLPEDCLGPNVRHVELFSLRPHPTDPTRCIARLTMLVPADRAEETDLWDRNWERVNVTIPEEDFAAAVDEIRVGANEHMLVDHLSAVRDRCAALDEPADVEVAVG